jgi:hypothetical protein
MVSLYSTISNGAFSFPIFLLQINNIWEILRALKRNFVPNVVKIVVKEKKLRVLLL